jgi:hypothetical protein
MPSGPTINPLHGLDLERPVANDETARAKAAFAAELESHWQSRRPESWVRTLATEEPESDMKDRPLNGQRHHYRSRRGAFSSPITPDNERHEEPDRDRKM